MYMHVRTYLRKKCCKIHILRIDNLRATIGEETN